MYLMSYYYNYKCTLVPNKVLTSKYKCTLCLYNYLQMYLRSLQVFTNVPQALESYYKYERLTSPGTVLPVMLWGGRIPPQVLTSYYYMYNVHCLHVQLDLPAPVPPYGRQRTDEDHAVVQEIPWTISTWSKTRGGTKLIQHSLILVLWFGFISHLLQRGGIFYLPMMIATCLHGWYRWGGEDGSFGILYT